MKANATVTTTRKPAAKTAATKPAATPSVAAKKPVSKPATKTTPTSKATTKVKPVDTPAVKAPVVSAPPTEVTKPVVVASAAVEKPGVVLTRKIEATKLTLQAFARKIGVKPPRLTQIIAGKRRLTADTALRLGLFLNEDPVTWMGYQAAFDLQEMAAEIGGELASIVPFTKSEAGAA
jgi:addiction module HigA family antidote